jgi:predicted SnoaL-like aldol condensation-catalyzing enzyme
MTDTQAASEQVVVRLWEAFDDMRWDDAASLLHPDFIADWPQSKERFRCPANFITMNREYPGRHRIKIVHLASTGNQVTSVVQVISNDKQKMFAVSFFAVTDGKIMRATEYFADTYGAPAWRSQWVEPIPEV